MNVIVVGGGAAGMMAAYSAAENGAKVTLYEKNEKLGKKVFITGKGRCNVTNAGDTNEFFDQVISNPKFLYSAVYGFDAFMVMELIENYGCPLKTERGNRVFPVSELSDIMRIVMWLNGARNCILMSVMESVHFGIFSRSRRSMMMKSGRPKCWSLNRGYRSLRSIVTSLFSII